MTFAAKFKGWCTSCNTPIRIGDDCDYAGNKVVHEGCAPTNRDPFDAPTTADADDDDREPQPIITGRRNHQRKCCSCNTIHAGECW